MGNENAGEAEDKKDEKLRYLVKTFSRTTKKDYENYILSAIWHKLNRSDIQPVTQQYIKTSDGQYHLMDLYFPQLNYWVECDEEYHDNNTGQDRIRELSIKERLAAYDQTEDCDCDRICAYKNIESVEGKIDYIVGKINEKIQKKKDENNFTPWYFDKLASEVAIEMRVIRDADRLAFKTIVDACRCFGKDYKDMRKSWFSIGPKHYIWFPKLAVRGADGELKPGPKGWINILSDNLENFTETNKHSSMQRDREKDIKPVYPRITFAKSKNELGQDAYRFIGVYEYDKDRSDAQNTKVVYKRIARHIDLAPWIK